MHAKKLLKILKLLRQVSRCCICYFELPFEVHTDASNKAIGGMLVQEKHLVDYESRKLNEVE